MAKAALTKLFILVSLALIICLPEFFSLYRVSKVNFLCQPYRPCERGNQVKKREHGNNSDAEINIKVPCDPPQTPTHEKWEQACTQDTTLKNRTGSEFTSRRGGEDPKDRWFICRTDMDMAVSQSNTSSSALKVYLEVSVEFQHDDTEILNLTLYGRSNHSSLYLHLPEEEDEQKKTGDEGQEKSFYCCLPSEFANQSHCLLWLSNQTVLTAKEKLPWKQTLKGEWRCVFRVLWLALLCLILLTIFTTVIGQIYWQKSSRRKPKVRPIDCNFTAQQLNDGEKPTEVTPKGTIPQSQSRSELSTIPECQIQEDMEMLLDGNVNNCYTAQLHHRGHPSTSALTEEQVW